MASSGVYCSYNYQQDTLTFHQKIMVLTGQDMRPLLEGYV